MREIKQDRNHNRHKKKIAALLGIFCVGAVLFSGCAGVRAVQKGKEIPGVCPRLLWAVMIIRRLISKMPEAFQSLP